MANMTNDLENDLLDAICSVTQYTSPATVYLALFTADPTDLGTVTSEVSGGSYARKSLSGLFTAATGTTGISANTSTITFVTATAAWGAITHLGFMKSGTATTDDMIIWGALASTVTIADTDIFEIAIGDLVATLA